MTKTEIAEIKKARTLAQVDAYILYLRRVLAVENLRANLAMSEEGLPYRMKYKNIFSHGREN